MLDGTASFGPIPPEIAEGRRSFIQHPRRLSRCALKMIAPRPSTASFPGRIVPFHKLRFGGGPLLDVFGTHSQGNSRPGDALRPCSADGPGRRTHDSE